MSVQQQMVIEDNTRERRFDVDGNFDGWRLDKFLANRIDGLSRSKAGRVAKEGDVEVHPPRKIKAGTRLRTDDLVIVREHLPPETVQDRQVDHLYEDDALLVIDKPAGMLVHETAKVRLNTVTHYLKRRGLDEAEPVHRIDEETSGVLVCAKFTEWVAEMRDLFSTSAPQKIYRALVVDSDHRWMPGNRETIDIPLGFDPDSSLPQKMGPGDLEAVTHVESLGRQTHADTELADLRIRIETGRQHQIRIHLAMCDTPIAGDKLYGQGEAFFKALYDRPDDPELLDRLIFSRQALHARRIELPHPVDDDELHVESELPEIW